MFWKSKTQPAPQTNGLAPATYLSLLPLSALNLHVGLAIRFLNLAARVVAAFQQKRMGGGTYKLYRPFQE